MWLLLLWCSTVGIAFNGVEISCGIAHILCILLEQFSTFRYFEQQNCCLSSLSLASIWKFLSPIAINRMANVTYPPAFDIWGTKFPSPFVKFVLYRVVNGTRHMLKMFLLSRVSRNPLTTRPLETIILRMISIVESKWKYGRSSSRYPVRTLSCFAL